MMRCRTEMPPNRRICSKDELVRSADLDGEAFSTRFQPGLTPSDEEAGPSWWFAFKGHNLLVTQTDAAAEIPKTLSLSEVGVTALRTHYLGQLDGCRCFAAELPEGSAAPAGMAFQGLRALFGLMDDLLFSVAGRAIQIVNWDQTHQFCGRCGVRTEVKRDERARICPQCGHLSFPRLSPAVIVAVVRGSRILLAHASHFPDGMYSVLAGFVEPGETLEECVQREVYEEVGLRLKNIRYFGSQPWPFPHSLMIAFTAEYAGGRIAIDGAEIADACWFTANELPRIPGKISIARRLIDWFVESGKEQVQSARGEGVLMKTSHHRGT
jgi:NAD+ diphosphatase